MSVKGHALRNEGSAFRESNPPIGQPQRVAWNTTSGKGFGLCSCGARSPIFESSNMRKAWHRNHKSEVVAQRETTR